MALTIIPNQPVSFEDTTDACKCDSLIKYKQLVNVGDITQFQVKLSPCNDAAELLNDPGMDTPASWTLGGGWSVGSSQLCRDAQATTTLVTGAMTAGTLGIYQIEVYVSAVNGSFGVYLGSTVYRFGTITETGTYTFIIYHPGSPTQIIIQADNAADTICIDNMSLKKIPAPVVKLLDSLTDTLIETWHGDDILNNTFFYPGAEFTFAEDSMTFNLDWDSISPALDPGCYYICLVDPCDDTNAQNDSNIINNGDFAAAGANWTFTPIPVGTVSMDYAGGDAEYTDPADGGAGTLENSAVTVDTICYDLTFVVSVCTLGRVRVECGTFLGTWRTAAGTYTEQFTSDGSAIIFRFEDTGSGAHQINIDNIVMVVCDASLICTYFSNDFLYGSHECTHLLNVCNNENGMGFVFGASGFIPRIRLKSKYVRATYKAEREFFEDSSGKKSVVYFKRRKARALSIDPATEYVHDFLSTLMGYDHFFIGATEYFVLDDEYSPIYIESDDELAGVIINIEEKYQLVENTNCGDDDNACMLTADEYLGTSDGYTIADTQGNCIGFTRI